MLMNNWVIYGGGGHARVLADAIKAKGEVVANYFDDNEAIFSINNIEVKPYHESTASKAQLIIGIGNNKIRKRISKYIVHPFGTLIHPTAVIAADVAIGEGAVILAGVVIQSGAVIGKHVVVNANVTIDHDAQISDFCSIYPNSYIGGAASIGSGNTIEACSVINRMEIIPAAFMEDEVIEIDLPQNSY